MDRPPLDEGAIRYLLSIRDGGYAFDSLRELACSSARPDLSTSEEALVGRGDALADLAVATFGFSATAVRAAYLRGATPQHCAAALGNPFVDANGWAGSVLSLSEAKALLSAGDSPSLAALFSNPRLRPDSLEEVFNGDGPAAELPDAAWPTIFMALSRNPSLGDLFDTRGLLPNSASRAQMHKALFHRIMALTPTCHLHDALSATLYALNDLRSPSTWFEAPDLDRLLIHCHPCIDCNYSGKSCFRVVLLLAVMCTSYPEGYEGHVFPAVRAAGMALAAITSREDLQALHARDSSAFFSGMPFNQRLYDDRTLGLAFLEIAAYKNESAVALYLERRSMMDRLSGADLPVTRRDLDKLCDVLDSQTRLHPDHPDSADSVTQSVQDAWEADMRHARRRAWWRSWAWTITCIISILLLVIIVINLKELHLIEIGKVAPMP